MSLSALSFKCTESSSSHCILRTEACVSAVPFRRLPAFLDLPSGLLHFGAAYRAFPTATS